MVLDEDSLPSRPRPQVEGLGNLLWLSQWGCPFEAQLQGWGARFPAQPLSAPQLWCQVEFFRCKVCAAQTQVFRRVQSSSQHQRRRTKSGQRLEEGLPGPGRVPGCGPTLPLPAVCPSVPRVGETDKWADTALPWTCLWEDKTC